MYTLKRFGESCGNVYGVLLHDGEPVCVTCEPAWLDNQRNISCIPIGTYACKKIKHRRYGVTLELINVPDRAGILIHSGNTAKDSRGCIIVGLEFGELQNMCAVLRSRAAMRKLRRLWQPIEYTKLEVRWTL